MWMWIIGGVAFLCVVILLWVLVPPPPTESFVHEYRERGYGHSYGPGGVHQFNPGGSMKACHACGQKLPLKVGEMVETAPFAGDKKRIGIVTGFIGSSVNVLTLDGHTFVTYRPRLTRLHGYYRITERETL